MNKLIAIVLSTFLLIGIESLPLASANAQSMPTMAGPVWVDTSIRAGTTISADTTITAGTGFIATTGGFTATAGNIASSAGLVVAGVAHTSTAALPAISACGTTPPAATAGSNNNSGQFTLGTGTPTACTVTFANAYANYAYCTVTPASAGGAAIVGGYYLSAQSKTAFTLTIGTGTDSLVWNYTCVGN